MSHFIYCYAECRGVAERAFWGQTLAYQFGASGANKRLLRLTPGSSWPSTSEGIRASCPHSPAGSVNQQFKYFRSSEIWEEEPFAVCLIFLRP